MAICKKNVKNLKLLNCRKPQEEIHVMHHLLTVNIVVHNQNSIEENKTLFSNQSAKKFGNTNRTFIFV